MGLFNWFGAKTPEKPSGERAPGSPARSGTGPLEWVQRDLLLTLLSSHHSEVPPDPRTEALVAVVLDLLMEVEALRAVLLASDDGGRNRAAYRRAYQETAYLTHNACGPSSGIDKLLALFYPERVEEKRGHEVRTWRECVMLRRLGFSEEEITRYKEAARQAEMFT
jgi:hypothetical protein